jgi:hypothetical protein
MKSIKFPIILLILTFLFIITWIVFYPRIYAIHDEAAYMAQAYVMREGTIFGDVARIQVVSSVETEAGHYVTKYAPGTSVLLIPFTFLGWKSVFLLPLLLHLLGFFVFGSILRLRKVPIIFSLLYLIYPTSVLYSRTLMADVPSAVFFLIGLYFYLRKKNYLYLSGFFLGVLPLFRYSNVILAFPFFLLSFIKIFIYERKNPRERLGFIKLLVGFIPGIVLLLFYNKIAFGGFFSTPLGATGTFSLLFLPRNFLFYIVSLSIVYPFMFFSIFFEKKNRFLFWSTTFIFLIFYSSYYYFTLAPGRNMLKTLIVGVRFLLPIAPIFILTYAGVFEWLRKRIRIIAPVGFWAIVFLFSILDVGMVFQHQRYLRVQERYKNCIYQNTDETSLILTNYEGMEFFQPAWGKRQYTLFVYWKNRIPIDLRKYEFEDLLLLTVIRSDKEGNEYVKNYAEELIEEFDGELVKEMQGDPELRLWRLKYEGEDDSVSVNRSTGVSGNKETSKKENLKEIKKEGEGSR